jgi:endo-alpha-1,4-polygalactosaminidase (GH114 family)
VLVEEAQQMTGTIHVADDQGDTTHTWDTTDPRTIRAIEELFQQAQATGRLVYRQTSDGSGHQLRLAGWNPAEHTELFVAPRLAGG